MNKILVSVIIPAFNESKVLPVLLKSLRNQTYKNIEIIVIDDSSTDKTVELARKFTNLVFTRPHQERSKQRNFGVKKSKGDYLLFLDADMELTSSVIMDCITLARTENVGGIIIPEISVGVGYWAKVKAEERSWYLGDDSIEAERFFKRTIFEKAGGYDEKITGPEDWDLPRRTRKLAPKGRVNSFIIHHEGKQSFWKMVKKKYYYGLCLSNYLKKNNSKIVSSQQIYFLRPGVLKNIFCFWKNPTIIFGVWILFVSQSIFGGLGYLIGKFSQK